MIVKQKKPKEPQEQAPEDDLDPEMMRQVLNSEKF